MDLGSRWSDDPSAQFIFFRRLVTFPSVVGRRVTRFSPLRGSKRPAHHMYILVHLERAAEKDMGVRSDVDVHVDKML